MNFLDLSHCEWRGRGDIYSNLEVKRPWAALGLAGKSDLGARARGVWQRNARACGHAWSRASSFVRARVLFLCAYARSLLRGAFILLLNMGMVFVGRSKWALTFIGLNGLFGGPRQLGIFPTFRVFRKQPITLAPQVRGSGVSERWTLVVLRSMFEESFQKPSRSWSNVF